MDRFHNPEIHTAHDVRKIRVCIYCNGMGSRDNMLPPLTGDGFSHGRCYAAANGRKKFLSLPQMFTDRLTVNDIGGPLMKALLRQRKAS